ncbi:N-6 DNA methylase [Proteus mirabilis]|uniref:N-6 DNA methylase n=1 Tax=Proteus mirabilis TaxID=584 RepID=UPI003F19D0AF
MAFSTLFNFDISLLNTEAEVETRFLSRIFNDLGYPDSAVIPKSKVKPLKIHDGVKSALKEVDFLLKDASGIIRVVVEAKDPTKNILDAWGQAASYALSYNRNKKENERIKWLLISNGHVTSLFPHDSDTPIVTLQFSDFASGMPPYVALRNYIKYTSITPAIENQLPFDTLPPAQLNRLFADSHNIVWKKEKLAPADAFFEFCKFIFIKIKQDKIRESLDSAIPTSEIPLTLDWLHSQKSTSPHPVRDILFTKLHETLENAIIREKKKRIFEKNETLRLSASTCETLIELFQSVNLSSIDEDLNGRMFEVFLAASIRGKDLGQFFTPRSVVDFMTRVALRNIQITTPPKVMDACCGTGGFLIEVMAYILGRLRDDTRLTDNERQQIKEKVCNESLFGVEANERVARIARINMYLHGDGGSHIFHADGLDTESQKHSDMTYEQQDAVDDYNHKVKNNSFDIILTNPPFSMVYDRKKTDEKRIMSQYDLAKTNSTVKSSILFINRYYDLLKPNGEMLIVLDDTVLNGKNFEKAREWIMDKFIILGVHSLPFNAFFKAKANIKTSILHLRKKQDISENQGYVFMSISNNIGHDNALKDTPFRNSLTEILIAYLEWQRTGILTPTVKENTLNGIENLECSMQYWLTPPNKITTERFDAFFYSIELSNIYNNLNKLSDMYDVISASELLLRKKLTAVEKKALKEQSDTLKYIEIGDVTQYGLITKYIEGSFDEFPTRGEYQIRTGDVLVALNNSSRGTVVLVPPEFDMAICTSGFLVIKPKSKEMGLLLWYSLRSEVCRKQIYYLAQTASQPELKIDAWNNYFKIPIPKGSEKKKALSKIKEFYGHVEKLSDINSYRLNF